MQGNMRRQHYVWQFYLKGWGDNVWCLRKGKLFYASTENVAHQRDFYRVRELSQEQTAVVQGLIDQATDPRLRALNETWLKGFNAIGAARRLLSTSPKAQRPDILKEIDILENTFEERMHSSIEGKAVPHLRALRDGDTTFLDDPDEFRTFVRFLVVQSFRGPGLVRRMKNSPVDIWGGAMRQILATNVGWHIVAKRQSIITTVLRATPSAEFITGDKPVFNTRDSRPEGVAGPVEELELYYPVSPRVAILVTLDPPTPNARLVDLTESEVARYNRMVVQRADEQIYAASKSALEAFRRPGESAAG